MANGIGLWNKSTWKAQNMGNWRLQKGLTVIPCSEVLKKKWGPSREIKTYHVQIVAGGHKQIQGVNYTKTFSAAAKLPSVHVVLANRVMLDWEIHKVILMFPSKKQYTWRYLGELKNQGKKERYALLWVGWHLCSMSLFLHLGFDHLSVSLGQWTDFRM